MKSFFMLIVLVLGSLCVTRAYSGDLLYVPMDHILIPNLGEGWQGAFKTGFTRALFIEKKQKDDGRYPSSVRLVRRSLNSYERSMGVWHGIERSSLPRNHTVSKSGKGVAPYEISYSFVQNLMPVDGLRFYHQEGSWLYFWECQAERKKDWDMYKWCSQKFSSIQWLDQERIRPEKKILDGDVWMKSLPFDKTGLERLEANLVLKMQSKPVLLNDLLRYAYTLTFKSFFYPFTLEEDKKVFQENLDSLSRQLAQFPEAILASELLKNHVLFLKGKFSLSLAQKLAQSNQAPPFWLLSLWIKDLSGETALNLVKRAGGNSALEKYLMGHYLLNLQKPEEALFYLKTVAKQGPSEVALDLAKAYSALKNNKEAKLWAKKLLTDKGSFGLEAKLLLAKLEQEDGGNPDEADKIYQNLTARQDLSAQEKARVLLAKAKGSANPAEQIELYLQVLGFDSTNLDALYALGRLYLLERADKEKSLSYFDKFLVLAPQNDERVKALFSLVSELRKDLELKKNINNEIMQQNKETGQVIPHAPVKRGYISEYDPPSVH